jgi:hypothetical protein
MEFRATVPGDLSMVPPALSDTSPAAQAAIDIAALTAIEHAIPADSVWLSVTVTSSPTSDGGGYVTTSNVYYKRLYSVELGIFLPTNQQGTVKSKPVSSHLQYDYFQTASIDSIPLYAILDQFPYPPVVPPALPPTLNFTPLTSGLVVEPSTLKRWKGNIWERVTRIIPNGTV